MNPENTNRDMASQPPQLCESLGFEIQISRDIFTLPPLEGTSNGHFSFIGSNHGPSHQQTLHF